MWKGVNVSTTKTEHICDNFFAEIFRNGNGGIHETFKMMTSTLAVGILGTVASVC